MRIFFVWSILVFCCLAIGCGLQKYISVRHNVAASESMSPTIKPGDHFASVGIKDNDIDPIDRFDIVVFKPPPNPKRGIDENMRWVFRVVGLSGEKIELKKGLVFINDKQLAETSFEKVTSQDDFKAIVIPQNEYFLMGDNRPNSEDSRYIKTIKREDIDGKVDNIIRKEDYENGKRW